MNTLAERINWFLNDPVPLVTTREKQLAHLLAEARDTIEQCSRAVDFENISTVDGYLLADCIRDVRNILGVECDDEEDEHGISDYEDSPTIS